ncbi:hypothetical protein ES705_20537 [subsurface metagenome]
MIDLEGNWGGIKVYDKELAEKLEIEPSNFEKERKEAFKEVEEKYQKEKKTNPKIGTFEEWWTKPRITQGGGRNTRKSVWESWHNSRVDRNVKEIRLTPNGIKKAKELLIVKS